LRLLGGTFTLTGNASTATSEQLGAVGIDGGFSTVNLNKGTSGTLSLAAASLSQTAAGAVVNFAGASLGTSSNTLTFTTAPTLTNNILPYATVGGADFAV